MYDDIKINLIYHLIRKYVEEKQYIKAAKLYVNNFDLISKYIGLMEQKDD
ncbi:MAG: hypothetical protein IAC58_05325 [Firmicutes bacterium]|uniref:Uncharacterized protein n=1 Tax=Candidatus Onthovivens merdipullorum TaxID=2840889 RepID=A0A9D9GXJ4_9BACL|nr:hypothetical protein [Candidatus Onthovivens merdipullorum]